MTPEYVSKRVAAIEAVKDDDESAHAMEDRLWEDVLAEIARGNKDAPFLAAEALQTKKIEFSRWCA